MQFDIKSNIDVAESLAPAAYTGNATGSSVDLQGFHAAAFLIVAGAITDGTHTVSAEESDDGTTWTAVDAADLDGSFVALTTGAVQKVGYKGAKRYVRAKTTVTGATTGGVYTVSVLRARPTVAPV